MSGRLRHWLLVATTYFFGVVLAGISYGVSRGADCELFLFFRLFSLCAILYAALMILAFRPLATLHSIGNFFFYAALCWLAANYDSHLEEMAKMLPFLIFCGVAAMIAFGTLALFGVRLFLRLSSQRKAPEAGATAPGQK